MCTKYADIGDPIFIYTKCQTYMWYDERMDKHKHQSNPKFQLCCGNGKVQLPLLKEPPTIFQKLLFDTGSKESKNYQKNIKTYNMMFAFTSPRAKVDNTFNNGHGPPNLHIHWQSCHRIGSLLPFPRGAPKFAQLYIYDADNEIHKKVIIF